MKNVINKFFVLIITLLSVVNVFAGPTPPAPAARRPPPPPGLPIDENIFVLVTTAILLGTYIFYKNHLKTKASI